MKKLLIVSISFLWIAGFTSMVWAHGPKSGGHGFISHGHSKPHFSRHSHKGKHLGRKLSLRPHQRSRHHLGREPRVQKHSRRGHGIRRHGHSKQLLGKHSHLRVRLGRNHRFGRFGLNRFQRFYRYYSPTLRKDYEDRAPQEESRSVPQHTPASHIYYDTNPEPWFLYGKSKEFRQLGLIPPIQ